MANSKKEPSPSVDPDEIAHFSAMADTWWDPDGPFKPLHKLNPTRIQYIKSCLCEHFEKDSAAEKPFKGLRILDIGCGGGLLSEPIFSLGATMVSADASEKNIKTAAAHAKKSGLDIDYRYISAEELAQAGEKFDVILNMEVIEHVADIPSFLTACRTMLKPEGCMLLSTLNRTKKSWLMAIAGAEYIMRWLPIGTHDWQKFLKPSELCRALAETGFEAQELTGMKYDLIHDRWSLDTKDLSVNYLLMALPDE